MVRSPLERAEEVGFIDATEAELGLSIDLLRSGGHVAPEVTVRRVSSTVPWTNRTLSAVATRVATFLTAAEGYGVVGEVPHSLAGPIRSMARLAATGRADLRPAVVVVAASVRRCVYGVPRCALAALARRKRLGLGSAFGSLAPVRALARRRRVPRSS